MVGPTQLAFLIFILAPRQIPRYPRFARIRETVCVAEFRTPRYLGLVDLRNPRATVSPFELGEAADILQMRNDLPFLERLGTELMSPIVPQSGPPATAGGTDRAAFDNNLRAGIFLSAAVRHLIIEFVHSRSCPLHD